jgi:hypothetical protein
MIFSRRLGAGEVILWMATMINITYFDVYFMGVLFGTFLQHDAGEKVGED